MRVTNHHGRGSARHAGRTFDLNLAPHIDQTKTPDNKYWTCYKNIDDLEDAERTYYRNRFAGGIEAQNDKYRARRQYARVREVESVYDNRMTSPEGSLLYIGDKTARDAVTPDQLWKCAMRYAAWEMQYSKAHGEFYRVLTLAMHVDERGQIHVEERGVYQHQDAAGNWYAGQAAALEAAGFPLPEPEEERSRENNRKMTWDALRREKWIAIVEKEPEQRRSHPSLEVWLAQQEAAELLEQAKERAGEITAEADRKAAETLQEAQEEARQEGERIIAEANREAAERLSEEQEEAKSLREDNERLMRKNAALRCSNRFYEISGSYRAYQERVKAHLDAPAPEQAPYDQIAPKRRVKGNQEAQRQTERVGMLEEAFSIDYSGHEREDRQL